MRWALSRRARCEFVVFVVMKQRSRRHLKPCRASVRLGGGQLDDPHDVDDADGVFRCPPRPGISRDCRAHDAVDAHEVDDVDDVDDADGVFARPFLLAAPLGDRPPWPHVASMRSLIVMAAAVMLPGTLALPSVAVAQTVPTVPATAPLPPIGASPVSLHQWQLDQHRYEMDRLRVQADQRQAFAEQLNQEARLTAMELQHRRVPLQIDPVASPRLLYPGTAAKASERRRAVTEGVGQIDAWLDRAPAAESGPQTSP